MYKWRPLQHAFYALSLCLIFPIWKWGAKMPLKNVINLFVSNWRKSRTFTASSISRFGCIKEMRYKDWKMSLYKPRKVRVGFCWTTEKSKIIQLKVSFHNDNIRVDFDANFVIFSSDSFSFKFKHASWNYRN